MTFLFGSIKWSIKQKFKIVDIVVYQAYLPALAWLAINYTYNIRELMLQLLKKKFTEVNLQVHLVLCDTEDLFYNRNNFKIYYFMTWSTHKLFDQIASVYEFTFMKSFWVNVFFLYNNMSKRGKLDLLIYIAVDMKDDQIWKNSRRH